VGLDPAKFQRAGLHICHLASTHEKAWEEIEQHLHWHMKTHSRALAAAEN
jgi:hypothetical protein